MRSSRAADAAVVVLVALVALGGSAGCDWILGIEPPAEPDASFDANLDMSAEATSDAATDAIADVPADIADVASPTWCTGQGSYFFCDDFDSDAAATAKWDSVQGAFGLVAADTSGSAPNALQASAATGNVATLTKTITFNPGTVTIQFRAQFDCAGGTTKIVQVTPAGTTTGLGPILVYTNGTNFEFADNNNGSAHLQPLPCDSNWHAFKIQMSQSQVYVLIDSSGGVLETTGATAVTGVTLYAGSILAQAAPRTVLFDNVIVGP